MPDSSLPELPFTSWTAADRAGASDTPPTDADLLIDMLSRQLTSTDFFNLLQTSAVPCWLWQLSTNHFTINPRAEQLLPAPVHCLQDLLAQLPPVDGERLLTAVASCLRHKQPFTCELTILGHDISKSVWLWGVSLTGESATKAVGKDKTASKDQGLSVAGIVLQAPPTASVIASVAVATPSASFVSASFVPVSSFPVSSVPVPRVPTPMTAAEWAVPSMTCLTAPSLTQVIDQASVAITLKDIDGRYLLANQAFLQRLNVELGALIGATDADLFDQATADRITAFDGAALQHYQLQHSAYVCEDHLHNTAGETLYVTCTRFPVVDDRGEVIALGNVMTDITQQRRCEIALLEQKAEQQLLFDSMRSIIWYVDKSGRMKTGNKQAQKVFSLDRLVGKNLFDVFGDVGSLGANQRDIMQVINTGKSILNSREQYINANKTYWYQVDKIPTHDLDGEITGAMVVMNDITQKVLKEKALEESESRYRNFITGSSEAVFRYDLVPPVSIYLPMQAQVEAIVSAARITECNQAMADLFGVDDPAQLHGLRLESSGSRNYRIDLEQFVENDYRIEDHELIHVKAQDGEGFIQINAVGIVEDDCLIRIWGTSRDITERQKYMQRLEYQANHDALTGLPNRNYLYQQLIDTLQQRTPDQRLALMIIDLDHFKEINDTLGHHVGDNLLCQIGPRIEVEMDDVPHVLARLGGDEFAVLLPRIRNAQQAVVIAHRLLDAISQGFDIDGFYTEISASIGLAFGPDQGSDITTLMRYADVAMYHAKSEMKGVAVYKPELDRHSTKRLSLINDLGRAIRSNQLQVYFQPKIDTVERQVYAFESLLRWRHPQLGFIPPNEFIPLAEMTNLIHPLTLWVLEESVKQCCEWRAKGYNFGIAVNLSVRNLLDESLPQHVSDLLQRYQLPAHLLELEITESCLLGNQQLATSALEKIHALGVELAIDDFGTGFSSLSYLKRLPVQQLKIDYTFVVNMLKDKQDEIIVNSTIHLAHNLGLSVIAEGVETEEHLQCLLQMGCDKAQGYHIGRPMPAADVELWLQQGGWHSSVS